MASTFTGFSEEDLRRIKSGESSSPSDPVNITNIKKAKVIGAKPKRPTPQYKSETLNKQGSEDSTESLEFEKCKLSIKPQNASNEITNNNDNEALDNCSSESEQPIEETVIDKVDLNTIIENRKNSAVITPDLVKCLEINYSVDELASHKAKLEDLQLKQKIMEEQNKKRKEMLAKALADRTKQTEEEVMKLEKIKKELQILDGQFSVDVAVLRKKIDQACLSYSEAEKHYLRVEKEFLQAKISLQKEKEKKELLTEHLCALITHNETRKAQKLETLMLQLASDRKLSTDGNLTDDDEKPVIIDGVDQRTGKIVEFNVES